MFTTHPSSALSKQGNPIASSTSAAAPAATSRPSTQITIPTMNPLSESNANANTNPLFSSSSFIASPVTMTSPSPSSGHPFSAHVSSPSRAAAPSSAHAHAPATTATTTSARPPTQGEIERRLSMRSTSTSPSPRDIPRSASQSRRTSIPTTPGGLSSSAVTIGSYSTIPGTNYGSVGGSGGLGGGGPLSYESDSSNQSNPNHNYNYANFVYPQPGSAAAGMPSSPTMMGPSGGAIGGSNGGSSLLGPGPGLGQMSGIGAGGTGTGAGSGVVTALSAGGGVAANTPGLSAIAETDPGIERGHALSEGDYEDGDDEGADGSDEDAFGRRGSGSGSGSVAGAGAELLKGMEGERVLKSGYLLKKGERRKNWKKRWFVLRNAKLAYYKDDREYVLCRILDLPQVHTCVAVQLKKHAYSFGIVTAKRTYYVRAGSGKEMDEWIHAINEARRTLVEEEARLKAESTTGRAPVPAPSSGVPAAGAGVPNGNDIAMPPQSAQSQQQQQLGLGNGIEPCSSSYSSASAPLINTQTEPTRSSSQRSTVVNMGQGWQHHQAGSSAVAQISDPLDVTLDKMNLADTSNNAGQQLQQGHVQQDGQGPSMSENARDAPTAGSSGGSGFRVTSRPVPLATTTKPNWERKPSSSALSLSSVNDHRSGATASSIGGNVIANDYAHAKSNSNSNANSPIYTIPQEGVSSMAAFSSSEEEDFYESEYSQPHRDLAGEGRQNPAAAAVAVQRSPIQTDPDRVILNGYLMKMGIQRKTWRKRWFVLTSSALMYTKSHMESRTHRSIPLSAIVDALEADNVPDAGLSSSESDDGGGRRHHPHPGHHNRKKKDTIQNVFQVVTPKRTFKLCAPTEEEEIKWLAALRALVNRERSWSTGGPISPTPQNAPRPQQQQRVPPEIHAQPPTPTSVGGALPTGESEMTPQRSPRPSIPVNDYSYFPQQPHPFQQQQQKQQQQHQSQYSPHAQRSSNVNTLPPQGMQSSSSSPLRGRSATQTAKSAVADVVRRFNSPGSTPPPATPVAAAAAAAGSLMNPLATNEGKATVTSTSTSTSAVLV